ncbi:hypothetical protein [Rheinheimera sp. MMS21-TC3]|uniref:hypothetical protein n=1 Tax=Rheinheimera sp. MMS21-TC3 TaxID=3072790 RepID=UPI0028C48657|nr:hypothetical protein [Rheinheimera sp. MMS21-TC3]WNO60900.1 hypothetical protein RDV63_08025 [Rheinheimera sp. MMS21-TC3]
MAQPVTVYRWDDPGAPQLDTATPDRIIDILKKCLIEGYGTKSPLGWAVAFEDAANKKIVFRNDPIEGSGSFVQFWHVNDNTTYFRNAESMTGLDSFIYPGYLNSINLRNTFDNGKWIVAGTKTAFYLMFARKEMDNYKPSTFDYSRNFFCGDFISTAVNDVSSFICVGYNISSDSTANTGTITTNTNNPLSGRGFSGNIFTKNAANSFGLKIRSSDGDIEIEQHNFYMVMNGTHVLPDGPLGGINLSDVILYSANGNPATKTNMPLVRGVLPGLLYLPTTYYASYPYPYFEKYNGDDYLLLPSDRVVTGQSGGCYLMLNAEWWDGPNRG